jgi:hypothetical protein
MLRRNGDQAEFERIRVQYCRRHPDCSFYDLSCAIVSHCGDRSEERFGALGKPDRTQESIMPHRAKNKHRPRHHTHQFKAASLPMPGLPLHPEPAPAAAAETSKPKSKSAAAKKSAGSAAPEAKV